MNESSIDTDQNADDPKTVADEPVFGLVDVVEAFTAMRHESRGQRRETRELSESILSVVENVQGLEAKLLAAADSRPDDSKKLVELIADVDSQLSRAVASAQQLDDLRERERATEWAAVQQSFAGMNAIARWLAGPFFWRRIRAVRRAAGWQPWRVHAGVKDRPRKPPTHDARKSNRANRYVGASFRRRNHARHRHNFDRRIRSRVRGGTDDTSVPMAGATASVCQCSCCKMNKFR